MLEELRRYRNLGTPNFFFELLSLLKNNKSKTFTRADIEKLFFNRTIDGKSIFDGCIEMAIRIKVLELENNFLKIENKFLHSWKSNFQMNDKFIEYLFSALKEDAEFYNIFCSVNLSYDITLKSFQINNRAFGLKYSNFKQLLINFGVIVPHHISHINIFIINNRFKYLFEKTVVPFIKKKLLSLEDLKKRLEQQQLHGEDAEKFVLSFENNRLANQKEIVWVAAYAVNEGYDIASYDTVSDELPNRLIEVKSFDGPLPRFFWTRNEFNCAKHRNNNYWLYLVNRTKMKSVGYKPMMIQNPYFKILLNEENWSKVIEKYKLTYICAS